MRLPSAAKRDAALALGFALAAAAVLYPRALFVGEVFFERDLHLDWYPRLEAIARALRAGGWPLWDRSVSFGHPLLGDPGAQVAYPLAWLALAVPRSSAYTVYVMAHLAITALGALRLGRAAAATGLGAGAGAALWVASGPLQSSVDLWHHFAGACWVPWLLLAADHVATRPGRRAALALGAAGGVQALAGSADVCVLSWAAALAWVAVVARPRARPALAFVAGVVVAVGLSALVWLPAAEVVSRSQRRELPVEVRTAWSVPPAGLLRTVAPLDPARVPFAPDAWPALYDRPSAPLLSSLYLGVPVFALALLALADASGRRRGALLLALGLAALAFSLGPHGPVYPLATELLPVLKVFRYPSKAMLLAGLALSLAAGLGADALARGRVPRRACGLLAMLALAGALGAAIAASRFGAGAGVVLLLASFAAAPLAAHAAGRMRPALTAAATVALAVAGLVAAHAELNATAPAALVFAPPPLVSQVDASEGRRLYVYDYHTQPGTSEKLLGRVDPYRPAVATGMDPRRLEVLALRQYLPPPAAGLFGIEGSYDLDVRGLYPEPLREMTLALRGAEGTPLHDKLLRLGAVGTVVSLHASGMEGLAPEATLPGLFVDPIRVFRVPGARPRAWAVACAREAGAHGGFDKLADPGFDPSREVVLAGDGVPPSGDCSPNGEARWVEAAPDRVRVEADLARAGFVVLADSWDPGWTASVDGRPVAVRRANVAFRAVAVPAGRHTVEMVYRPVAALAGLCVSLATLAVALGVAIAARRTPPGGSQAAVPGPARS